MTIAEVGKKYDITTDTLRYYEKIGLIPPVKRTAGGIRDYDEDSCNWVELIKCLRASGVSVEALIKYVKLFKEGDTTLMERKNILIEQRRILAEKLTAMQETIARIDYKILNYEKLLSK